MANTLAISSNRSAVLSLTTLQHDNLTPLKVVLWEGIADSFGAGPAYWILSNASSRTGVNIGGRLLKKDL